MKIIGLRATRIFCFAFLLSSGGTFSLAFAQAPSVPNNQQIFLDRLQSLEQELSDLKLEIVESQSTLKVLKEQISGAVQAEARILINDVNDVGDRYVLVESDFYVDGKKVATLKNDNQQKALIYDDVIAEGSHGIVVEKLFRGSDKILPDFAKYTFRLKDQVSVRAVPGKTAYVEAISFQKDKFADAYQDRLGLKFDVKTLPNEFGRGALSAMEKSGQKNDDKSLSRVSVVVTGESSSKYILAGTEILIDGRSVPVLDPSIAMNQGQVIFEGPLVPGNHRIDAVLRYKDGQKPQGSLFKLRFAQIFSAQPGFKTTINLAGYQKTATVIPIEGESQGIVKLTNEPIEQPNG